MRLIKEIIEQVQTIYPYRTVAGWAFDDYDRGIGGEPFYQGIPEMIDEMLLKLETRADQVRLDFTNIKFSGAQGVLIFERKEKGGAWYNYNGQHGWLCPNLMKYFWSPPEKIYFKISLV